MLIISIEDRILILLQADNVEMGSRAKACDVDEPENNVAAKSGST